MYFVVDFNANSFPFWMPPISGVRGASFGSRSLCFHGHSNSVTVSGQPSEHWNFWILSRLAPRKGFNFEIRKPFEISSSLWWVWLATRWYALRALSSWINPHFLAFCGSNSCFFRINVSTCLGQCNSFYQLCGIFGIIFLKCLLAGEDSLALWSCYEACVVQIPFLTLPLLWGGAPFLHHWRTKTLRLLPLKCLDYFLRPPVI